MPVINPAASQMTHIQVISCILIVSGLHIIKIYFPVWICIMINEKIIPQKDYATNTFDKGLFVHGFYQPCHILAKISGISHSGIIFKHITRL